MATSSKENPMRTAYGKRLQWVVALQLGIGRTAAEVQNTAAERKEDGADAGGQLNCSREELGLLKTVSKEGGPAVDPPFNLAHTGGVQVGREEKLGIASAVLMATRVNKAELIEHTVTSYGGTIIGMSTEDKLI
eukprot:scaffold26499_cov162-Cylindrotheca_fusiformis.AAC.1